MTTTTFDTLTFARRLQEFGFTKEQAEGFAQLQRELIDDRLATRQDLREMEIRLDIRLAELKHDLLRWILGIAAGQVALIVALLAFIK